MKEELLDNKHHKMTTTPVKKLILAMSWPPIICMLVSTAYNLTDTFTMDNANIADTGAIGIVFAYMTMIQAVAFFFGHGSGNFISRSLGRKDRENAKIVAVLGLYLALITGIIIGAVSFIFCDRVLVLLGCTNSILPEARIYFKYIAVATPFIMGSFVISNQMRLQGNGRYGMTGIASGVILNMILDPVFILGMKKGIAGAGLATMISQIFGFVILMIISGKKDGLVLSLKFFKPTKARLYEIYAAGIPSLMRQGFSSVAAICINNVASGYGDEMVAAISVVTRITFFTNSILMGFGQGFQPICGFNFGARLYQRVKNAFWYCVKIALIFMCVMGAVGFIFAHGIVAFFSEDVKIIETAVIALRFQCLSAPLVGFAILGNMYLQNISKTISAVFTAMTRQGILFIPVLYMLNHFFGITGVLITQMVADICAFIITLFCTLKYINKTD